MNNLPEKVLEEIREQLRRPRGTVTFNFTSDQLFDSSKGFGILFQIVAGSHLFRIERDDQLILRFYHSSPGTRTRVAEIDLKKVQPAGTVFMAFTWEPVNISFSVGPRVEGGQLITANGKQSPRQFTIGADGNVYQIGDDGVSVIGVRVVAAGKSILAPPALGYWDEVIIAVKVLLEGTSGAGYSYDVAICNAILIMLVTGFESYCKRRFIELEQEGIIPDSSSLISSFFSKYQRESGYVDTIKHDAQQKGKSLIDYIIEQRSIINFQDYEDAKKAYNKVYGVKFGNIGITHRIWRNSEN